MWMEELPNGKYKFFERYKDPYTEKLKKVSVTMEKKTPQARNQAAILLQEKINKKLEDKNKRQPRCCLNGIHYSVKCQYHLNLFGLSILTWGHAIQCFKGFAKMRFRLIAHLQCHRQNIFLCFI